MQIKIPFISSESGGSLRIHIPFVSGKFKSVIYKIFHSEIAGSFGGWETKELLLDDFVLCVCLLFIENGEKVNRGGKSV